jgi:lysophospholipase L1-like esterase
MMHRMKRIVAAIAAAVALSFGIGAMLPSADATLPTGVTRTAADCPAANGLPEYQDYGSGCLDTLWPTRAHGQYGTLVNADVVIVGDSITTLCRSSLTSRLDAAGLTWGVSYWSSRPSTPAVSWALSLSAPPRILVMASGTNDIFNPSVMTEQINRLRSGPRLLLTQVYWVDVQAARPATAEADQRNSMWVNRQIWSAPQGIDGLAGVATVNWASQFYVQPNRRAAYLDSGGVHPNAAGCEFWGASLANQIIGPALAAKKKAVKPK